MYLKPRPLTFEVLENISLTPTVFELKMRLEHSTDPALPAFSFVPGQFVSVIVPKAGPNGRDLRRAYSIASAPKGDQLELCVKEVENGPGSTYLRGLSIGQKMQSVGPYGDFVYKPTEAPTDVYFISTGTGVAPFRAMVQSSEFWKNPLRNVYLWFGVRSASEIFYEKEWEQLSKIEPRFQYRICLSRPDQEAGSWFQGRVTHWMEEQKSTIDVEKSQIYLCGGSAMIDQVKAMGLSWGMSKEQIHQEIYYKEPKV